MYERGVALFKYPHAKDIWNAYLAQFVQRYGGSKLERARDLFRHALEMVRSVARTAHYDSDKVLTCSSDIRWSNRASSSYGMPSGLQYFVNRMRQQPRPC